MILGTLLDPRQLCGGRILDGKANSKDGYMCVLAVCTSKRQYPRHSAKSWIYLLPNIPDSAYILTGSDRLSIQDSPPFIRLFHLFLMKVIG